MLGIMIDCSRNAVMLPEQVKQYAVLLKEFGYDTLMLYTEDTFEVDGEPYFGHMRGRYSKKELKELDAFCVSIGIELIPCIQTLAHLNGMFKWWDTYDRINDIDNVLLIGEERTYTLIDNILSTVSQCFTSKKVHIGMDEADNVGLGKYLRKHGYQDRFDLINGHLHRVCQMAADYGLEPMIWSDMFTTLAMNDTNYYADTSAEEIEKRANLPENVSLVYWDYYSDDVTRYERMIAKTKCFHRPVLFAGGIWTWRGLVPDNGFSFRTTAAAIQGCRNSGVEDMIFCLWGDDGAECSKYAVLPAVLYAAEVYRGNRDMDSIRAKFRQAFGMEVEDFLLLDAVDHVGGKHDRGSASKYLLFNDPFNGLFDMRISGDENAYYEQLAAKLAQVKPAPLFQNAFEYLRALCEVLAVKSELGAKTRSAYQAGNKAELLRLATEDYARSMEKVKAFYTAFSAMWFAENKPFGFDVQDIRIGALLQRLESCQARLIAYCQGQTDTVAELEEAVIPEAASATGWSRMVTANVLSHIF